MYARIERFNMSQGLAELAAELTDKIEPIMRRQPGFQSLTLFSDETSGEYLALTIWSTLELIHTYERSQDELRVRDILSPHLTAIPQIEVYQVHNLPVAPLSEVLPAEGAAS
jgi:heme-degrading monooxygenase HmoA